MSKRKGIIVDLDGTLCDTLHRQHFMTGEKKNWPAFYDALTEDRPNYWCLDLTRIYWDAGVDIIFVSGRPDDYRAQTEVWLIRHCHFYDQLLMRKSGDYRKDSIVKAEIYREHIEPYFEIKFCIDDRQQVVDMWRELGLVCLQCAKGDF